jgi:hypothetical protein
MHIITARLNPISYLQYVAHRTLPYSTAIYRYSMWPSPVLLHSVSIHVRLDTSATPSADKSSTPGVLLATATGHTFRHS